MDMKGEQRIPAARDVVWQALNDPEILKVCIPGCQELVKSSDTQMSAKVVLKVGPVSARFEGAVTLSDFDPPNSYRISGEGQGGMAGFAKGEAVVRLEADGNDTILRYEVNAQVGGKLAQLGARLIDATAKQMSAAFFNRFAAEIVSRQRPSGAAEASPAPGDVPPAPATSPAPRSIHVSDPVAQARGGASSHILAGLCIVAAALAASAYFFAGSPAGEAGVRGGFSADFAGAVILFLTAAVGYLFGRLGPASPSVVAIDRETLALLAAARTERRR